MTGRISRAEVKATGTTTPRTLGDRFSKGFKSLLDIGGTKDHVAIGVAPQSGNTVIIRSDTDVIDGIPVTAQIQRYARKDEGYTNPKALRVLTQIDSNTTATEWAVSAELTSNSETSSTGFTALSGVSIKNGFGQCFGGHFQVKCTKGTDSSIAGSIIGQELNIQANGVDDNTSRIGYDIIARTYAPNFATYGSGEFHAGIRLRNSLGIEGGKWINAIMIEDGTQATPQAITIENSPSTGIGYAISDTGSKARGIRLSGTYGVAAIDMKNAILTSSDVLVRLKDRGKIEFDTDVFLKWDNTNNGGDGSLSLGGQNTKTSAVSGAATALPAAPAGYLTISINGTDRLIPFYGV